MEYLKAIALGNSCVYQNRYNIGSFILDETIMTIFFILSEPKNMIVYFVGSFKLIPCLFFQHQSAGGALYSRHVFLSIKNFTDRCRWKFWIYGFDDWLFDPILHISFKSHIINILVYDRVIHNQYPIVFPVFLYGNLCRHRTRGPTTEPYNYFFPLHIICVLLSDSVCTKSSPRTVFAASSSPDHPRGCRLRFRSRCSSTRPDKAE